MTKYRTEVILLHSCTMLLICLQSARAPTLGWCLSLFPPTNLYYLTPPPPHPAFQHHHLPTLQVLSLGKLHDLFWLLSASMKAFE